MNALALASPEITLAHPWALFALVAAAGPYIIAARARRTGQKISRMSLVAQTLAIALAAVALAGPAAPLGARVDRPWLVLTDASASTTGQYDTPLPWDPALPRTDLAFASEVFPDARAIAAPDRMATDAAAAIEAASARARDIGGVIFRTDGRFNSTDWKPPAASLARALADRDILIVPMTLPKRDARVSTLATRAISDGRVRIDISLEANAVSDRTLRIEQIVSGTSRPLLQRDLRIEPGLATAVSISDSPPAGVVVTYRATLNAGDAIPQNDSAETLLIPPARQVAVIGPAGPVTAALRKAFGDSVITIAPPDAPNTPNGYLPMALVAIADDTGSTLTLPVRDAIAAFVRAGGGLLLVGSGPRQSYADRDDPLNRVLPLIAGAYERQPLAVTVVLDASGSMAAPVTTTSGRRRKFDQAAQGVLDLRKHLTPTDTLSVITFADTPRLIYDSGSARPDFAALAAAIQQVRPAGRTEVGAALSLATASPQVPRKGLLIVVSDLVTLPFDVDTVADGLRRSGQALAVVAVGASETPGAPAPLETLAAKRNATLVLREDLSALAEVFAEFLSETRGDAMRRGQFSPNFVDKPLGVNLEAPPRLTAYIAAAPTKDADVLARTGTDAILARRRVGLGRTVALAAASGENENTAWWTWPGATDLLTAAARWAMPAQTDGRFSGRLDRAAAGMHLQIDARDDTGPMNLLTLTVRVAPAEGFATPREFPMTQTGLGRYDALLPVSDRAIVQVVDDRGRVCWREGTAPTTPPELTAIGPDWTTLNELAERTGGRIVAAEQLEATAKTLRRRRYHPLWPYALALAVLVMLSEWVVIRT